MRRIAEIPHPSSRAAERRRHLRVGLRDRDAVDARGLEHALRQRVDGEVRFDDASRALYATDLSMYRQVPIGVVVPRHEDDVVAAVETCRAFGAPILGRGGGTSLAGQGCNAAVMIDMSKHLHTVRAIDPDARHAVVEPGVVYDQLKTSTGGSDSGRRLRTS